jgi:replicative DNA helicase
METRNSAQRANIARTLIHTPAEAATAWTQWAEKIKSSPGSTWGIPAIDRAVIPERPGEMVCILGRPGDGKSSLLAYRARREARLISENAERRKTDVVVYVTWESSVEELVTFMVADSGVSASDIAWGRADLNKVKEKSVAMAGLPVWFIGNGISRAAEATDHRSIPRMTPDVVFEAIEAMKSEWGVKVSLMCFDYMQLIPVEGRFSSRVEAVTEVPIRIKELALRVGCPALVAVQARREVDDRDVKISEMRDAQWASSIEQTADKAFAIWRPWRSEATSAGPDDIAVSADGVKTIRGRFIEVWGKAFQVSETLLFMRMLKQRGDRGQEQFALHFHPAYLKLAEMEVRNATQ